MGPETPGRTVAPAADAAQRLVESGLGTSIGFLLSRGGVITLDTANQAIAPLGISIQEYMVLAYAGVTPPPAQRELSEVLRLDPSRIVGLVDRLEQAGLVSRLPSPTDRRVKHIAQTPAGTELHQEGAALLARAHAEQFSNLSRDELDTLAELLRRIVL